MSVPWELGFEPPRAERLVPGRGDVVWPGADAMLVGAGPVLLSQAHAAAGLLAGRGLDCAVLALPWLRDVDGPWLAELAAGAPVFCLDNHYASGGQGDAVAAALAAQDAVPVGPVRRLAVDRVPECGTNDEVLHAHGLDAAGIAARVEAAMPARVQPVA